MAGEIITKEELQEKLAAIEAAQKQLEALSASNFGEKLASSLNIGTGALNKLGVAFPKVGDMMRDFMESSGASAVEIGKIFATNFAIVSNSLVRNVVNPAKDARDIVGQLPAPFRNLNDAMRGLVETEDLARTAMMANTDSMGDWSDKLADADRIATGYPASLQNSAAATGFFTKELVALDTASKRVPNAFRSITVGAEEFGGVLEGTVIQESHLVGLAFRGLGFTTDELKGKVFEMYNVFGQQGRDAIKALGDMNAAAQGTGVRIDYAAEQITDASKSLAIFGRGASTAAGVWREFNLALRDTVPVSEISKMVSDFTGKLGNMQLQHRAFIAQVSGAQPGTGMLGGALKMEMAMRGGGGLEQHMTALTQTLSQFAGGKVITLEQAVAMPELETQFVLQRQLLQQLTGVSGNEAQNRMLEVLQGVQAGGMTQIDGTKAMGEVMKTGKSLQERSVTGIEALVQSVRPFAGPLTTYLNKLNRPAQTGARMLGEKVALETPGGERGEELRGVPMIENISLSGIAEKMKGQVLTLQPEITPPGGIPEDLYPTTARGREGTQTMDVYTAPGPDANAMMRAQQRAAYGGPAGPGTRVTPVRTTTGGMAGRGINKAAQAVQELIDKIKEDIEVTKKQIETPVKVSLDMTCPDCHKTEMNKLISTSGGVYRSATA